MALLVHPKQIGNREMRIKLRRGDTGVAEKLLDVAQIGSAIEQVRREGMPQRVAMHAGEPGATRYVGDDVPYCAHAESTSTAVAKNKSPRSVREIASKRSRRFTSKKRDAFFVALAQDANLARIEIYVLDAYLTEFAHAAAGSVEQFQHCSLAWLRGARKQPRDFRFAEAARQAARDFGRSYESGGRKANQASKHEEAEKLAHSYRVTANRTAACALLPEARNEESQPRMRDAANIIRFQEIEESPN